MYRRLAAAVASSLLVVSCGGGNDSRSDEGTAPTTAAATTAAPTTAAPTTAAMPGTPSSTRSVPAPSATRPAGPVVARFNSGGNPFEVTEVARDLRTVWALAWDPEGSLWYTERGGQLTRLGDRPRSIAGVEESGEAGLMGLEIDSRGRKIVMYTGDSDNRIVRLEADGSQRVLVSGIAKAAIHDGGRLRLAADGALYAGTGDAGQPELSQHPNSLNGKVLRIDPQSGETRVFSRGHRNVQGLCPAPGGRLLATEHGPAGGDEINVLTSGFDGGWPDDAGNGIKNYTPSIAPAGCDVYSADLIPAWKGSMLFATLRGRALHRLSFRADGSVSSDEVLLQGVFGRLRDVRTGPDGAVYLATSNRDGRGSPRSNDDRILRIAPAS